MARSDLYLHEPLQNNPNHWRPATVADLGGGASVESSSATSVKQDAIIAKNEQLRSLLESVKGAIAPDTKTVPSLAIATSNGTVAAGAKFVVFTIYPNTTGTILGTAITPELSTVEFPFNRCGYAELAYTIDSGTIVITSGS